MRNFKIFWVFISLTLLLNANEVLKIGYSNKIFDIIKLDSKEIKRAKLNVKKYFDSMEERYKLFVTERFLSSEDVLKRYLDGKLDVIYIDTATYLKQHTLLDQTTKKYLKISQGRIDNSPFLLVSNIYKNFATSISDLENSAIAIHSHDELSKIYLDSTLNNKKLSNSKKFFSKIEFKNEYSSLLLNTFFNKTRSCIIPENEYIIQISINNQIAKKTKILEKSPPFFKTVALVHNSVSHSTLKILNSETKKNFVVRDVLFNINSIKTIERDELNKIKNIFLNSK